MVSIIITLIRVVARWRTMTGKKPTGESLPHEASNVLQANLAHQPEDAEQTKNTQNLGLLEGQAGQQVCPSGAIFRDAELGLVLIDPGKCISCSLTYGLPEVFSRHPIINIKGLVQNIDALLDGKIRCVDWRLGSTREISNSVHAIPLEIILES